MIQACRCGSLAHHLTFHMLHITVPCNHDCRKPGLMSGRTTQHINKITSHPPTSHKYSDGGSALYNLSVVDCHWVSLLVQSATFLCSFSSPTKACRLIFVFRTPTQPWMCFHFLWLVHVVFSFSLCWITFSCVWGCACSHWPTLMVRKQSTIPELTFFCSLIQVFVFSGPTMCWHTFLYKQTHALLFDCWVASNIGRNSKSRRVFVASSGFRFSLQSVVGHYWYFLFPDLDSWPSSDCNMKHFTKTFYSRGAHYVDYNRP